MITLSGVIIGLNLAFGAFLLGRVIFQLNNRLKIQRLENRVPSSATVTTLLFDTVIGLFLIVAAFSLF